MSQEQVRIVHTDTIKSKVASFIHQRIRHSTRENFFADHAQMCEFLSFLRVWIDMIRVRVRCRWFHCLYRSVELNRPAAVVCINYYCHCNCVTSRWDEFISYLNRSCQHVYADVAHLHTHLLLGLSHSGGPLVGRSGADYNKWSVDTNCKQI
jgi:hypothetical protein